MVQLNLLPDVKLEYIKAQRTKNLVMTISIVVIIASIGMFVAMFTFVKGVQGRHLANLENDIDAGIATIQNDEGVNEILTIQNQLKNVDTKHQEKPAAIRILPFVAQLLPSGSKVSDITVSFTDGTMEISGETPNIAETNKFVDTLKFAVYKVDGTEGKPFSDVVLSSYSEETGKATFNITMKFDPIIFDNKQKVALSVPGIVSTRSDTEKPDIEFTQSQPKATEQEAQ